MNVKLILAYDGTGFLGWQKTNEGMSIEETLQNALQTILQEEVILQAAGRTDAGVHAKGQVVNFKYFKNQVNLSKLSYSLNCLLPKSIAVLEVEEALESFHPTLDSQGKIYHYEVCLGKTQLPHQRLYSWHIPYPIDIAAMEQASQVFIGKHDFSAFCNVKKNEAYKDKVRIVSRIDLVKLPDNRLRIEIEGTNFLYKMVRNIVGTLVYVGIGKITCEEIHNILKGQDRKKAGITAPAHGLSLFKVIY